MKEFADNNFKFNENNNLLKTDRKHCGKTSNFSISHSVFKRHDTDVKTRACLGKGQIMEIFLERVTKSCEKF